MRALLLGALVLAALPAGAQPRIEVQGTVEPGSPLLVVLSLRNTGNTEATSVTVDAELAGEYDQARVRDPLAAGATTRLALSFKRPAPGPGVHVLALLIDSRDAVGAAISQRAWLLVSFGPPAPPPSGVSIEVPPDALSTAVDLPVRVRSTDGTPRRVRVRVLPPRGLQVPDPAPTVEVGPGPGTVVGVRVLRSGAPRPSTQGFLVVAEWDEHGRAAAVVGTGTLDVLPDPALLPRLRPWLVAAGAALLLLAAAREFVRLRQPRPEA